MLQELKSLISQGKLSNLKPVLEQYGDQAAILANFVGNAPKPIAPAPA